ncbi:hypothetical protein HYR54_13300 [Candidatus Acetothermia bacterium]|nr:hypothetical protein [Candidatus Acetothermia bacterium]
MIIVLAGNTCTGKKTVTKLLSQQTGIKAIPVGDFRRFHKDESLAWEAFVRLLRALDTPSTAPDDSVILTGVKHDRELWALLETQSFKHLTVVKLEAPLEILRERLAKRLRPTENLEVLYERMLVPGQEWAAQLPAHIVFDTSKLSAEEIAQRVRQIVTNSSEQTQKSAPTSNMP